MRRNLKSLVVAGGAGIVLLAGAGGAQAQGISGLAFYVDGELYRTVATPTDLQDTGAPGSTYDTIYAFGGAQPNVADAAPGSPGFNGGRWEVRGLTFTTSYAEALEAGDLDADGVIDSATELAAAVGAGEITVGGVLRRFVCTVNPAPEGSA